MITACRAAKQNRPMSNGSRNSAPPRPISPPRSPTPAPVARAAQSDLALAGTTTTPGDRPLQTKRKSALGRALHQVQLNEFEIRPTPDRVPGLLFVPVPEEKAGKNRLHSDFRPVDQTAEVQPLLSS